MKKYLSALLAENELGNRILAHNVTVSNDSYKTGLNNHDLVIGGSGSGKTTGYVCPNLNNPYGSIVVSDTKRQLYKRYSSSLIKNGYDVKLVDFVSPENSIGYNPLSYIRKTRDGNIVEKDIKKIASIIVPVQDKNEPFWENAAKRYISMIIGYVLEALPEEEHTMTSVIKLHQEYLAGPGKSLINRWTANNPNSYASRKYKMLKNTEISDKTWNCIIEFANEGLDPFDCKEFDYIFNSKNNIDLHEIGSKKTAVFLNTSDNDTSYNVLSCIFNAQLLQVMLEDADKTEDGRLAIPTRLILDDFAASAKMEDFDKLISILRSRDISVSIMLQSISQIKSMYGDNAATTILNNCDHILYLGGGNDLETATFIAEHINKTRNSVLNLENDKAILLTRGKQYETVDKIKPMYPETGLYEKEKEPS